MKAEASAGRAPKGMSLHDHCEKLTLRADGDGDAKFLATLWKAMFLGGEAGRAACREVADTFTLPSPAPLPGTEAGAAGYHTGDSR